MALDKDELRKLHPQERIKKLKELEEQRKKEASEIEDLLKTSESELKTHTIANRVTPEQRQVDISELFKGDDIPAFEVKKEEPNEAIKYNSAQYSGKDSYTNAQNTYQSAQGQASGTHDHLHKLGKVRDQSKDRSYRAMNE